MKLINWKKNLLSLTSSRTWYFWAYSADLFRGKGEGFEWFSAVPAMSISPTGLFLDNLPPGGNIFLFHLHAKIAVSPCSPVASFLFLSTLRN